MQQTLNLVPGLMDESWDVDPHKNLDKAMAYCYASDKRQSNLNRDVVVSMAEIIQRHSGLNNLNKTIEALKKDLTTYLESIFHTVQLDIAEDVESKREQRSAATVNIKGNIVTYGVEVPLTYSILLDKEGKLVSILKEVNK